MIFPALSVYLGDKPRNRGRNVVTCLSLVVLGLICTLTRTNPVFDVHAAGGIDAKFSMDRGPSEESEGYLSSENYFLCHRQLGYRAMTPELLDEGFLWDPQQNTTYLRIRETYINYDYGFSVVLPKPLVGLRSPPPFPNHGFVINLSEHPHASITVDASYNAAEWNSFREALNAHLDQFKRDSSGEVTIVMQRPAALGGLKAIHFSLRSAASESNEPMIRDVILALRKEPGGVGIVYEIALTTPALRYQKDRRSAVQLLKSFRLKALPK